MKPTLSVIIITLNSAQFIEKCLKSVAWADEIIILDSGSTDETVTLCRQYTPHVFQTDWPGFGPQKNRALAKATGDWIYSIDSDEWMSDALQAEIIRTLQNPQATIFRQPRLNQYCGHWVRFGDVGKDRVLRLFKRGTERFTNDIVHECIHTTKKIGELKSPLFHNSYRSLEELMQRMNRYSTLSAQMRFAAGKKTTFSKAILSSSWAFIKSYFFRLGFLDGKIGFVVSFYAAESSYYRHIKLLALHRKL